MGGKGPSSPTLKGKRAVRRGAREAFKRSTQEVLSIFQREEIYGKGYDSFGREMGLSDDEGKKKLIEESGLERTMLSSLVKKGSSLEGDARISIQASIDNKGVLSRAPSKGRFVPLPRGNLLTGGKKKKRGIV